MRSLRAWPLVIAACASGSTRPVVTTSDLVEAEPAAQPVPPTSPAPEAGSAAPPETGSAAPSSGDFPASNGPIVFGLLDGEAALEDAWDRWQNGKATNYDAAFEIAVLANRARPLPMSDELMVIALARAVELSACQPERLGRIRLLAIAVNTSPHVKELDGELARLSDMGPVECAALR